MIKRALLCGLMVTGALCLFAPVAEAQDLTDSWDFTVVLPTLCTWQGTMDFTQTGTSLAGSTPAPGLQLQPGGAPTCPPVLAGVVSGSVGMGVSFGLTVPAPIGMVNFLGTVAPDSLSMAGDWAAPGAVPPLAGTWSASRPAPAPTLPQWGTILMLALLLGAGGLALHRRSRQLAQ